MNTSFALQIQAVVKHVTRPDTHVIFSVNFVPVWCLWSYLSVQASVALSCKVSLILLTAPHCLALPLSLAASSDRYFYTNLSRPTILYKPLWLYHPVQSCVALPFYTSLSGFTILYKRLWHYHSVQASLALHSVQASEALRFIRACLSRTNLY